MCARVCVCVRAGARRRAAVGCCSLPGARGKEGTGQPGRAARPPGGSCSQGLAWVPGLGMGAWAWHGCLGLEAEISGVEENSCGGASEERGRHRSLLHSAFFLIASGEAAAPAALTCNPYHWGTTHLTASAAQLPLWRLDWREQNCAIHILDVFLLRNAPVFRGRTGGTGAWQPFQRRLRAVPCRAGCRGAAPARDASF